MEISSSMEKEPVILKIVAREYSKAGAVFGKSENGVWRTDCVSVEYVLDAIYAV
ncbi:MAG: hypothetical protein J6J73_01145 [Agathobacter sp.]|nr:hypothetical protein [Agathobacter sp.]